MHKTKKTLIGQLETNNSMLFLGHSYRWCHSASCVLGRSQPRPQMA